MVPCGLAPGLHEGLVRLATWVPSFAHAAEELGYFTGTVVPESTVRRLTEAAGAAYAAVQQAEGARLGQEQPTPPPGPLVPQLSVDGAMVPLVGGEWAEVKTLVVGTLTGQAPGESVRAEELSSFSQLADAEHFTAAALVETHRRGTETADVAVAVMDGAAWEQGFVDAHRVDAVRILDFGHAAGYLTLAAHAVYGAGTAAGAAWVERQRHELRHGEPEVVLAALQVLQETATGEARTAVGRSVAYLQQRREQIRYAEFDLLGLPLGSGIVESANKLLVEARLKGAGMHWARHHVTPMLALRTVAFNDRWAEAWPQIVPRLRGQGATAQGAQPAAGPAAPLPAPSLPSPSPATVIAPPVWGPLADLTEHRPSTPEAADPPPRPKRPAPDHPWRRLRPAAARSQPSRDAA